MKAIGEMFSDPHAGVVTVEKIIPGGYVCRDEFDEVVVILMEAKCIMMNLTPHAVDIYGDEGFIVTVQPSGTVARVAEVRESAAPVQIGTDISGLYIPVSRATYGAVTGLPEPDGETIYIVSGLVLAQCAGRADVFAPGPAIRDDQGRQIGCHGLSAAPPRPERTWDDRDHACTHGVDFSEPCPHCERPIAYAETVGWERAVARERAAVEAHHA